jgi:hypothetical protein
MRESLSLSDNSNAAGWILAARALAAPSVYIRGRMQQRGLILSAVALEQRADRRLKHIYIKTTADSHSPLALWLRVRMSPSQRRCIIPNDSLLWLNPNAY